MSVLFEFGSSGTLYAGGGVSGNDSPYGELGFELADETVDIVGDVGEFGFTLKPTVE